MQRDTDKAFYAHPDLQKALVALATPVSKKKGAVLFRQGQQPEGVFLLQVGKAELTLRATGEGVVLPRTVGPGSVLGLPASIGGKGYSLTAKTIEDCTLAFVDRKKVVKLLRDNGQLCMHAVEIIGRELTSLRQEVGGATKPSAAAAGK